jgi:pantoate--beta-alanine ligase
MSRVVSSVAALRSALGGDAPGLVPTMGALHTGHASLIQRAAAEHARTVVSIFVNPTQFSDSVDFSRYPRGLDRDLEIAAAAGADLIFAPTEDEVYATGFATSVEVATLTERWEGAFRPGHFRGVATVVTILLSAVQPAASYFGEKDYQQLVVIRRLHRDLRLPGKVVGCATVRDADGLALSSRNARLTAEQRQHAGVLPRALFRIASLVESGEVEVGSLLTAGQAELDQAPDLSVDYLAIVDPETLESIPRVESRARVLAAVRLGAVRLIDNVEVLAPGAAGTGRAG